MHDSLGIRSSRNWMIMLGFLPGSFMGWPTLARAQGPRFDLIEVGLTDAAHTNPTTNDRVSALGYVYTPQVPALIGGSSQRGVPNGGWTSWVFDLATYDTHLIGLHGDEHTSPTGVHDDARFQRYDFPPSRAVFGTTARFALGVRAGQSAWRYLLGRDRSLRIGLNGPAYTHSTTHEQYSEVTHYNARGDAAGISLRYSPRTIASASAWFLPFEGEVCTRVGLIDGVHVGPAGEQSSTPLSIDSTGIVVGTSLLFHQATTPPGRSAWVFDPADGQTRRLGLLDADHVDPSGYHDSEPLAIVGQSIIGSTRRFSEGNYQGETLWVYDIPTSVTRTVGFMDAEHTSASGVRISSYARALGSSLIAGFSVRWNSGGTPMGATTWVHDLESGRTTVLGLQDAEHTASNGTRASEVLSRVTDGRLVGHSTRYRQGTDNGRTLWLWSPQDASYTLLGYRDANHTTSAGARLSTFAYEAAGMLLGESELSDRSLIRGNTCWAFDLTSGTTTPLGLTGAEYVTDSVGLPRGELSNNGPPVPTGHYAFGATRRASRFGGGQSPWILDLQTGVTARAALSDARHTSSTGLHEGGVNTRLVNERTYGFSYRYAGSTQIGQSSFLFDAARMEVTPFVLSERSDGYAYSEVFDIEESGACMGVFRDWSDPTTRFRAFYRDPSGRAALLETAVYGGFDSAGYAVRQYEHAGISLQYLANGIWYGSPLRSDRPGTAAVVLIPRSACPADLDDGSGIGRPDGGVTIDDLSFYLRGYSLGARRADIDDGSRTGTPDGGVTIDDLLYFIQRYEAGC